MVSKPGISIKIFYQINPNFANKNNNDTQSIIHTGALSDIYGRLGADLTGTGKGLFHVRHLPPN